MNASADDAGRWTPRRWAAVVGGVFAVQFLLIVLLSNRTLPVPREPKAGFRITMAGDLVQNPRMAALPIPADPTLFALSSGREFTGTAWKRPPASGARLPEWTDRSPATGTRLPANLGQAPSAFLRSNAPPSLAGPSRAQGALDGLTSSRPPVRTQSTLRIEGILAVRGLTAPVSVPSWPHSDLLTNTVISLTIDARGFAVSASTRQGSGSADADRKAMDIARGLRFSSIRDRRLDQGLVVFEWHTLPPPPPARVPAL
jgi:hypothetical protein